MMSTACLLVPRLPLASAVAGRPSLAGQAVAIADDVRAAVACCSAEAERAGVRPGLPLREAVALCPALTVLGPRSARVRQAAAALVDALATVSPLVEEAAPGEVYADIGGLDGLYPRPGMLERAVLAAAPPALGPRVGVAGRKFTAFVAASHAAPAASIRVGPDQAADFLAPLPAAWLPLDGEAIGWLRLLGIGTMGAFAALPRQAVEAQFGFAGGHAWLAARGDDPAPVYPRPFAEERVRERTEAAPPLVSRESILLNVEQMAGRALRHPRLAGRFVRQVRLAATSEDGQWWERTQTLREPLSDRGRLWTAVRPLLEQARFPGPIAVLELELAGLTAESGRQVSLLDTERVRRREQLDEMVRHLKVRFGRSPLARVVEVEPWSRIPERRRALMDYDP